MQTGSLNRYTSVMQSSRAKMSIAHGVKILLSDGSFLSLFVQHATGVAMLAPRTTKTFVRLEHQCSPGVVEVRTWASIPELMSDAIDLELDRPEPPESTPTKSSQPVELDGNGVPLDFDRLIDQALQVPDAETRAAIRESYCGVFEDAHEYVVGVLAYDIAPDMQWIFACCDPEQLRLGLEHSHESAIWVIKLQDGRSMVFETPRQAGTPQI